MPVSPAMLPQPTIAARLRAAGCVYAEEEAELLVSEAGTAAALAAMVERRASGLPLEQIIGWAGFCGLRIAVEPGIFVPRRRTEFLVSQAIDLVSGGDGAIGATVDVADRVPGKPGDRPCQRGRRCHRRDRRRRLSPG